MNVLVQIVQGLTFFLLVLPNVHIHMVAMWALTPLCFHTLVFTFDVCRPHIYPATYVLDVDK